MIRHSVGQTLQLLAIVLIALAGVCGCGSYRPVVYGPFNVYLTLSDDLSHVMVVNYHTLPPDATSDVQYDTVTQGGEPGKYAFHTGGTPKAFTYIPDGRLLHCVRLQGLAPGGTYYFIVGDAQSGYSKEYKFRALPENTDGLCFIDGGDMDVKSTARTLLKLAAEYEPWFAIVGGDLSYASRAPSGAKNWDTWFKNMDDMMVTPKGYLVPLMTAVGNHEINKKVAASQSFEARSPFYWRFFGQQAEQPYFSRKLGNTAFFFLDAGNLVPHEGTQTEWLAAELTKYQSVPVKFAVYHQPLYPAYRDFNGSEAVAGRKYWAPVFDKHHLAAAFEHHDHVFKRSKLLKNNAVSQDGTLYVGDGCFGQKPRRVAPTMPWYLEKSSGTAHFWVVDVSKNSVRFRAVDTDGTVFDDSSLPVASGAQPVINVKKSESVGSAPVSPK